MLAEAVKATDALGTLIFTSLMLIGFAIALTAAMSRDPEARFAFWIAIVGILITAACWIWASWPLKYDYHHWVDVRGKVERVSSRFISAGDDAGTNQRFVFVIGGKAYGVDDTRAALAHRGNRVHLRCKKEHQLLQRYEDDGWACRWMNDSEIAR
jgi:hypothetical protein